MLGPCVLLALAGGAVPTQEVTLAFPPAVAVPATAALVREGRGEPAPVVLARRGEAWVAALADDAVAAEEVWALAGDDWVISPVRGRPVEALAVSADGRLEGSVDVPPGRRSPAWGWVEVRPAAAGESAARAPERFPLLVSSHRFSAFIPVGRWQAALEFPGFSRVELGEMAMAAGATLALPAPVVLHPAATARLHVVAVNAPGLPGLCRAWLFTVAELDAAQCALVYEGTSGWSEGGVADRLGGVHLQATAEGEGFAVVECPPWPPHLTGPAALRVGEEAAVRAEVGPAAGVEMVAPFVVEFAQTHAQNRAVLAAYPRASRALSWCAFEAEFAAVGESYCRCCPEGHGSWSCSPAAASRRRGARPSSPRGWYWPRGSGSGWCWPSRRWCAARCGTARRRPPASLPSSGPKGRSGNGPSGPTGGGGSSCWGQSRAWRR